MISVVIPLYNKETTVVQAVHSVLNQTMSTLELIVVNDSSTDGSMTNLKTIKDDRMVVISIPHSGVSVARNTGINHARNQWVAFLDADDWWAPEFLEEMILAMDSFPEEFIFASGRTHVFEDHSLRYRHKLLPHEGTTDIVDYFTIISKYLPPINSSNVVIHTTLFEEIGVFNPEQNKHEDHDLWLRLSVRYNAILVNKPLSFYRKVQRDKSNTRSYGASDFCQYLATLIVISNQLAGARHQHFEKYYSKFVIFTYGTYYWGYSKTERRMVLSLCKQLLSVSNYTMITLINWVPFNAYVIAKRLR